jgi:ferredoxin-NADP reductase/nitrite reductase/ring-hydroxylating ferredoxin subunit
MTVNGKDGYQRVANKNELKESSLLRVEPEGKPIVLAMVKGNIYAMDAVCSHEGGPLEDGTLQGYELKCPWHYAIFDVRNAKVSKQTVWATDLQSYPVKVDDATGDIMISLQTTKPASEGGGEATVQDSRRDSDSSQKKYYEEEEQKAHKISLELLSKEALLGTDIMTFRLTRGEIHYTAGQYAFFKLDGVSGDAKGPIRHFSIASSPTEQDYILISTRIRDTPYKQKLASLEKGTKILAWGPQGEFVLHDDDDHSKPAVFLSGGIGVTPFRSMIKYATDKQLPAKIIMFDSNKNQQNILYKDEFDKWASQNKNVKVIYTVTEEEQKGAAATIIANWSGERSRIDKSMLERHLTKDEIDNAVFYICGPPGMLKAMQELLQKELQIPKDRLKVEAFTGY